MGFCLGLSTALLSQDRQTMEHHTPETAEHPTDFTLNLPLAHAGGHGIAADGPNNEVLQKLLVRAVPQLTATA